MPWKVQAQNVHTLISRSDAHFQRQILPLRLLPFKSWNFGRRSVSLRSLCKVVLTHYQACFSSESRQILCRGEFKMIDNCHEQCLDFIEGKPPSYAGSNAPRKCQTTRRYASMSGTNFKNGRAYRFPYTPRVGPFFSPELLNHLSGLYTSASSPKTSLFLEAVFSLVLMQKRGPG